VAAEKRGDGRFVDEGRSILGESEASVADQGLMSRSFSVACGTRHTPRHDVLALPLF
jgi:hypothetical protein